MQHFQTSLFSFFSIPNHSTLNFWLISCSDETLPIPYTVCYLATINCKGLQETYWPAICPASYLTDWRLKNCEQNTANTFCTKTGLFYRFK